METKAELFDKPLIPIKPCRVVQFADGGVAVVDPATGDDLWVSWTDPVRGALNWCAENGYTPLTFGHMDVLKFDPELKTMLLDWTTYDPFRRIRK